MKSHAASAQHNNAERHRARKRFGQNFLRDQGVIDRIIRAINPLENEHLLEIGPGQGALTKQLAASGSKLDCVELDRDLSKHLSAYYQGVERVSIYQHDILKFDLAQLGAAPKSLRVIGNLPYNISTPVLFYLLRSHELIKDMTFMLQVEVVRRLAAQTGDKNYGRLGLMVQYFCRVDHLFDVPSSAFTPKPKVDSAIVRLTPHDEMPHKARSIESLQTVIRTAFNARRKTLKNALKAIISEQELDRLSLDSSLRPENLTLADYVLISNTLTG